MSPNIVWDLPVSRLKKYREEARRSKRNSVRGDVPEWLLELAEEFGESRLDLEGIRKLLSGLRPALSEEIVAERGGDGD